MESALEVMKENNCKPSVIYCTLKQASREYHNGRFQCKGSRIYFDGIKVINYMTGNQFLYHDLLSSKDV